MLSLTKLAFFPRIRKSKASGAVLGMTMLGGLGLAHLCAQDLQTQPTPLSTYLDLRPALPGGKPQNTPAWIDAFEFIAAANSVGDARIEQPPIPTSAGDETLAASEAVLVTAISAAREAKSVFRIRLRRPAGATNYLQARVFFDDSTKKQRPRLTAWNELGMELMRSKPLGQGLGLPSSETLLVPMAGVDYLEIETPGDGSRVRGAFLSWMTKTEVLQSKDFLADDVIREPFGSLAAASKLHTDAYLYGVVTAPLQDEKPLVLKPAASTGATYQFEIEQRPLLAVVTYEVLGATVGAPLTVTVNQRSQGESELHLPDLADPGYRGESEEGKAQMSFRYTGWVRAQKVIPGHALVGGLNNLTLELSNDSKSLAIRSVSIQLKYNWDKLDYVLSPTPVPP